MNLDDYSKSIGLSYAMSLEELIDSHKRLRDAAVTNNKLWREELQKARQRGQKEGYCAVTEGEFISVAVLRDMTVVELIALINNL